MLNKLFKVFILGLSVAFLFSCASNRAPKNTPIHFHTRITSSGLKHFQVSMVNPLRKPGSLQRQSQNNPNRGDREERSARSAEKVLAAEAQAKIEETQFCKNGYWFLGNNFYGRTIYVRGECNETATEEDRNNFPDTLLYW